MKRREMNKKNTVNALNAVFTENATIVNGYPALKESVAGLRRVTGEIDELDKKFITSVDGKTSSKNLLEEELLEDLMPVKAGLYAYSVKGKNEELKTLTKDSESSLRKMPDPELLKKTQLIIAEAEKLKTELADYKITEEVITELKSKTSLYAEALDGKDTSFANRSALRIALTQKFDEADEIITEELDQLIELVRKSHPLFYDQYQAARTIKDLGGAHKVVEEEKTENK